MSAHKTKIFKRGTCSNCRGKKKRVMKWKSVQLCGRCVMRGTFFNHMQKLAALKLMREWA